MKKEFFTQKGGLGKGQNSFGYSSAVKIGNVLELSGLGGHDENWEFPHTDILDETRQCFKNIELVLKECGASFKDVFCVTSYFTVPLTPEIHAVMADEFEKRIGKKPIWTTVQVVGLGVPQMRAEVVVKALINE